METSPERRDDPDRRVARRPRFIDRRTGFDRREPYPILGTLRDSRWALIGLLLLINALSLLDGFLTSLELQLGIATEGNPVFGTIIAANPLWAAGFKVLVMASVSVGIWRWRRYRAILALVPLALALYTILLSYHLGSLSGLGLF